MPKIGEKRTIKDKKYVLCLLKVIGKDQHGRPKQVTMLYDENVEHLEGEEEYITAFVLEKSIAKSHN